MLCTAWQVQADTKSRQQSDRTPPMKAQTIRSQSLRGVSQTSIFSPKIFKGRKHCTQANDERRIFVLENQSFVVGAEWVRAYTSWSCKQQLPPSNFSVTTVSSLSSAALTAGICQHTTCVNARRTRPRAIQHSLHRTV